MNDELDHIFEQRAEKLSRDALESWTANFTHDAVAIQRLKGQGAKLLIGPRGSGKTTLMRLAYFQLLDESNAFPVYVNYSKSFALEPLFQQNANALALFRQWLIMKGIDAAHATFMEADIERPTELTEWANVAGSFIERIESRANPQMPDDPISPNRFAHLMEQWGRAMGRHRCVLLMDDAAHAFSAVQQRDFFEFFRSLKSRTLAPKAAVYPGITEYSPYFHVGHDGDLIEAWANPDDSNFLQSMRAIISRRFTSAVAQRLEKASSVVDALSYASFGLPRSFLNMIAHVLPEDEKAAISWARAREAIRANANSMRSVFTSLEGKLPRYRSFVEIGTTVEDEASRQLRKFNRKKSPLDKAVTIAIKSPLGNDASKILAFLEYAGILRKLAPVSRGKIGRYERYALHYSIIIETNALILGKSPSAQGTADALGASDNRPYPKLTVPTLFGERLSERCIVDLSPCSKCKTSRLSPDAHFCHKCGNELTDVSIYDEALRAPIAVLPITDAKKSALLSHGIKTVHDIIITESGVLRDIPTIGESWAARIKTVAEEHVSV
jgi:hypothetical protein